MGLVLVKDLLRHSPDGSVALGQLQMRPLPRWGGDGGGGAAVVVCRCELKHAHLLQGWGVEVQLWLR